MASINSLKNSKFLTQNDVGEGVLYTIKTVEEVNIAKEGAPEEFKWCIFFNETEKPLVLNSTNGQIIAKFLGDDEMDNWTGHEVVLYTDPTISFGGKVVGGIRVRAPKKKTAAVAPKPTAKPATAKPGAKKATVAAEPEPEQEVAGEDDDSDSVPF